MKENSEQFRLSQSGLYQIQVQGTIGSHWLDYFDGLDVRFEIENGLPVTTLTGLVTDQAALQGMLQKLYSLGLILIKVERKENETWIRL